MLKNKLKVEVGEIYRHRNFEGAVVFNVHMVIHIEDNLVYFADGKRTTLSMINSGIESGKWERINKLDHIV